MPAMKQDRLTESGPWAISIRTSTKSIMKIVPLKEDETLREALDRTKEMADQIRVKYKHRDDLVVEIISRKQAFPKSDKVKLKPKELWCPYCVKPRQFRTGLMIEIDGVSYESDYKRCVICGISENDYHVKTENHLWPEIRIR